MKSTNIRKISELGIALALSVILGYLKIYQMPQGGSVSLEMVPIFLLALRWGWRDGIFLGFTYGILQILLGGYVYHWAQALLDYPIAFSLLGLVGLARYGFENKKYLLVGSAIFLAGGLRFIAHVIAGVIFFSEYAPEGMNPVIYSIIYNASYMVPEIIISIVVTFFLFKGFSDNFFTSNESGL